MLVANAKQALATIAVMACLLGTSVEALAAAPMAGPRLSVPSVQQVPERCGPAALEMVLRYYGADEAQATEGASAYDPILRGSLITDLAAAARRAGFDAEVGTLTLDSLVAELAAGVPPIVLYQNGRAPLTVPHFAVLTGWDPRREVFTLNEGKAVPRVMARADLARRWRTAGSLALLIRRRVP